MLLPPTNGLESYNRARCMPEFAAIGLNDLLDERIQNVRYALLLDRKETTAYR